MPKKKDEVFLPVLGRGESYIEDELRPGHGGGEKEQPFTIDQIRQILAPQIAEVQRRVQAIPDHLRVDDVVISLGLLPDYLGKSYFPNNILDYTGLNFLGSKSRKVPLTPKRKKKRGKYELHEEETRELFVSGPSTSIQSFSNQLDCPFTSKIENDLIKMDLFTLKSPEQKLISIDKDFEGLAEIVLHGLPSRFRKEEVDKFLKLCRRLQINCNPERIRDYYEGPIFCPVIGSRDALYELATYNPLRVVRPIPEIELTANVRSAGIAAPIFSNGSTSPAYIVGMFDAGVDTNHPSLAVCVQEEELTTEQAKPQLLNHGTAVASALAYGLIDSAAKNLPSPRISIQSFRLFPVPPIRYDADLNWIIDQIEATIPQWDIKIYNISFGPKKPIEDDEIDRFTWALDRLALKHKVVFFVPVGNDGTLSPPFNRIQPASDIVNGVGVGALTRHISTDGLVEMIPADYSCPGPGRLGALRKPDISAFGGSVDQPFLALSHQDHIGLNSIQGTSFSCPLVAGITGELLNIQTGLLNPIAARALILHTARPMEYDVKQVGVGEALQSVYEILRCEPWKATVIFQGTLDYDRYIRLPILLPKKLSLDGIVKLNWTVIFLPNVNPNSPDEYTLEEIEVIFRPHDQMFEFRKKGVNKGEIVNVVLEPDRKRALLAAGYRKSNLPKGKDTPRKFATEQELRAAGRWNDTVIIRQGNTRADGLHNPSLTLHVDHRYGMTGVIPQKSVAYACVMTIGTKNGVDLYSAIRQEYRALVPLRIRERVELIIE